jgi:anti-sigma factor RsiW
MNQAFMGHPSELDLAAFSSGDLSPIKRFIIDRHARHCGQCQDDIAHFREIRAGLAETKFPDINWDALASEMRANIHLGLEAGACVGVAAERKIFSPRLAAAFASLLLLAGAGFILHDYRPRGEVAVAPASEVRMPMLQSSGSGVELRTGPASFALLNSEGGAVSQTVSAQGAVRTRDIDETGAVTIKDVYLQ